MPAATAESSIIIDDPISVLQFTDWANHGDRWKSFTSDLFHHEDGLNAHACRPVLKPVTFKEFRHFCEQTGYRGLCAPVFAEIRKVCKNDNEHITKAGAGERITLRQMVFFRRRCSMHLDSLGAGEWGSPACALVNVLRHRRGASFRGWRTDVDTRGNGRVGHKDFVVAMRAIGMGAQTSQLWRSFRPDGSTSPLEYRDVDPEGAALTEGFVQAVGSSITNKDGKRLDQCELDLLPQNAFNFMDHSRRNHVTFEDFCRGLTILGFQGNEESVRLLFHGLLGGGGSGPTGDTVSAYVTVCDFEYLYKVFAPAYRRRGTDECTTPSSSTTAGSASGRMATDDATPASPSRLSKGRPSPPVSPASKMSAAAAPQESTRTKPKRSSDPKAAWNDRPCVDEFVNKSRPKCIRQYFGSAYEETGSVFGKDQKCHASL